MREICQSGSEGGGVGTTGAPYPYHAYAARSKEIVDAGLRRHDAEGGGRASIIRYVAWYETPTLCCLV